MLLFTSSRMSGIGVSDAPGGNPITHPSVVLSTPKAMPRPVNCVVFVCWISVSVLLHGSALFASNISTQIQLPNATVVQDEEDTGWDSTFLQLRDSLLSYSQPVPPYTLLTNAKDYHYMPKPRHRRPSRLLRLLGSSFDLFWMSIDQPSQASGCHRGGQPLGNSSLPAKLPSYTAVNLSASPELREAAASHRQKLVKEAADLDLGSLPSHVGSSVRDWLVRSATCGLSYQWVDLGPAFWPRWLRHTDCEKSDGVRSCSFPGGMECVRAQTARIKILAWHCLEVREGGDVSRGIKAHRSDGRIEMGTGEVMKRCIWAVVPYPVVTACSCSCK
ncbi:noggin-2-like [Anarrhichthys ocellatus]|uniref:noggin-2-like n=1 Tax=Anarrhichthys ocellatus TaxID=433405 RepID=UPI0012EDF1E3|nr:noggin-2-like [Anarrhichthys ocellatus]